MDRPPRSALNPALHGKPCGRRQVAPLQAFLGEKFIDGKHDRGRGRTRIGNVEHIQDRRGKKRQPVRTPERFHQIKDRARVDGKEALRASSRLSVQETQIGSWSSDRSASRTASTCASTSRSAADAPSGTSLWKIATRTIPH